MAVKRSMIRLGAAVHLTVCLLLFLLGCLVEGMIFFLITGLAISTSCTFKEKLNFVFFPLSLEYQALECPTPKADQLVAPSSLTVPLASMIGCG